MSGLTDKAINIVDPELIRGADANLHVADPPMPDNDPIILDTNQSNQTIQLSDGNPIAHAEHPLGQIAEDTSSPPRPLQSTTPIDSQYTNTEPSLHAAEAMDIDSPHNDSIDANAANNHEARTEDPIQ